MFCGAWLTSCLSATGYSAPRPLVVTGSTILYRDLEALATEGFISVTESDEERTEIALDRSKETMVQEAIAQLPESLRTDVMRVLEHYGALSHNQLLATVYAKYPAFATESRLRRRRFS
jgi:hypothetical protein